jgi:holin-like protein
MKVIKQLTIIFLICLTGNYISTLLPFVFPGNIISLVLLFILLDKKILREKSISIVGDFLLSNMGLFFIPSTIGIMTNYHAISSIFLKFILIIIFSTLFTFFVSSKTVTLVIYLQEKYKSAKEGKKKC